MKIPVDKYGFLRDPHGWSNHLPLLLLALEATKNSAHPILELGTNGDSNPLVQQYCKHEGRRAVVIDDDILRCAEARPLDCPHYDVQCAAFDEAPFDREAARWSVAVVSNKPGERRQRDAKRLAERANIIILRDSEPAADYGYKFSEVFPLFRWRVDVRGDGVNDGAWSSAVSNSYDLIREWRGLKVGPYTLLGPDDDKQISKTSETIKEFQKGNITWDENDPNPR